MKQSKKRRTILAAATVTIAAFTLNMRSHSSHAQPAPSTQPATGGSAAPADADPVAQIMSKVESAGQGLDGLLSQKAFTDSAKRAEVGPKVIPILKKLDGYATELLAINTPQAQQVGEQMGSDVRFMLVVFGDPDAKAKLQRDAGAPDLNAAQRAQASMVTARWITASGDAAAQGKALDDMEAMARTNPGSDPITLELIKLAQFASDNPDATKRIDAIVSTMKSPAAAQWAQMAEQRKQTEAAQAKLKSMESKPLAIAGPTVDGKTFTTADWKGKVILVDFWATWCGPCLAELPRVKKVYKDFHDKGFEIIGVSCDRDGAALKDFITKDAEMPWPQLFDAKNPQLGWHPIAQGFGIDSIPTMFLIDKDGNLRSADARENFEEMIPRLLAETPK